MTVSNSIGTITEYGAGRGGTRISAPVGYSSKLFKGTLWMLQLQGMLTAGVGNSALTVVMRGSTAITFTVTQQTGNSQAIAHTYSGGALTLQLGTDSGGSGNTTPAAAAAYLRLQAGLVADFLAFIPGGTGLGVMVAASVQTFKTKRHYIPGSATSTGLLPGGRGEEDVDNTGGLPGAVSASAWQSVFKMRNDDTAATAVTGVLQDCYVMDDDQVSVSNGSSTRSKMGQSVAIDVDGGVFVDMYR